jgi:regulator of sigma E protease
MTGEPQAPHEADETRSRRRGLDLEGYGQGDGAPPGRFAWLGLVAAVVALALGSWTLLVAILGLALLIFVHELGHFIAAKAFGMRVERFYIGFPPAAWRRRRGETEYGVGLIPLGGFCKISGMMPEEDLPEEVVPRAYYARPVWQRNITILAGPVMNFVAAFVIVFIFLLAQGVATPTLTVDLVEPGSPADNAGLQAGDRLVSGDGAAFATWDEATAFFLAHPDQNVTLAWVTAAGAQRNATVRLASHTEKELLGKGKLGVGSKLVRARPGLGEAISLTVTGTYDAFRATFQGLWMLVSRQAPVGGPNGAVGPVGITRVSQEAVRAGYYPLLLAFISINLGIMNLLPILPFDGGHVVLNTAEWLRRGRRLSRRVTEGAVAVGVTLVVALFLYLTWNDLGLGRLLG